MTVASRPASPPPVETRRRPGPKKGGARARYVKHRDEIVDIAAELFARNGFDATGMAELCEATGLGKGALYHYIESKEKLLNLVQTRVLQVLIDGTREVVGLPVSARERLRELGRHEMRIIERYGFYLQVVMHEYRALTPDNADRVRELRRAYEGHIRQILDDGVQAREFCIDDLDLAVLAWLGMHNYAYLWFRTDRRHSADDVAEHFYNVYVNGVAGH
jgi:TetR/AcrR family transcriptional regulator, cholesterol catabolism regulator